MNAVCSVVFMDECSSLLVQWTVPVYRCGISLVYLTTFVAVTSNTMLNTIWRKDSRY